MGGNTNIIWRRVRRFFVGVIALLLLATVSLVALHTYYHFTPVGLSADAQLLDRRAQALPRDTDNGLRLLGLLAPEEIDPVVFGRCLLNANRTFWAEYRNQQGSGGVSEASDESHQALANSMEEARLSKEEKCANGKPLQVAPTKLPPIRLNTDAKQWRQLADAPVDPTLLERYEAVMDGEARHLGFSNEDPSFENFGVLSSLHRIHLARAGDLWASARQEQALDIWEKAVGQWVGVAPESLVSTMLAAAALNQTLISMQVSMQQTTNPPAAHLMERVLAITNAVDRLPDALAASGVPEWAMTANMFRQAHHMSSAPAGIKYRIGILLVDTNDTLNRLADQSLKREALFREVAQGRTLPNTFETACPEYENSMFMHVSCLIFNRNPLGKLAVDISNPAYDEYPIRIADVLNFAAATRLVLSARQQQVTADALPQWVQQAPANMRDIYTGQPFAVEPAGNAVLVNLKHRNSFLGEPGAYRLPL
jgi:hypothetical protein